MAIAWNPHPVAVHFPIALIVSALLLEIFGLARGRTGPVTAARWALWFGTLAAGLAVWSGHEADEAARLVVAPAVDALIVRHHDRALWTLGGASVLSVWRLIVRDGGSRHGRLAYLGLLAVLVAQIARTAHLGGRLVFEYGVGVRSVVASKGEP